MRNRQPQESRSYQQMQNGEQQGRETALADSLGQKWSKQENKVYLDYLEQNFFLFKTQRLRKQYEVFSELGKLIGTRTSKQVKTHHNRMIRRFKSLEQILRELPKTIETDQQEISHVSKRRKSSKNSPKVKPICIQLDQQSQKREKQSPVFITVEEEALIMEESVQKEDWELLLGF